MMCTTKSALPHRNPTMHHEDTLALQVVSEQVGLAWKSPLLKGFALDQVDGLGAAPLVWAAAAAEHLDAAEIASLEWAAAAEHLDASKAA
jgi:hypothetical protein